MHIIKLVQEQNKTQHNTTVLSLPSLCMYVCMHAFVYVHVCMYVEDDDDTDDDEIGTQMVELGRRNM